MSDPGTAFVCRKDQCPCRSLHMPFPHITPCPESPTTEGGVHGPARKQPHSGSPAPRHLLPTKPQRGRCVSRTRPAPRGVAADGTESQDPSGEQLTWAGHVDSRAAEVAWIQVSASASLPHRAVRKPERGSNLSVCFREREEVRKEDKREEEWKSATRRGQGRGQWQRLLNG